MLDMMNGWSACSDSSYHAGLTNLMKSHPNWIKLYQRLKNKLDTSSFLKHSLHVLPHFLWPLHCFINSSDPSLNRTWLVYCLSIPALSWSLTLSAAVNILWPSWPTTLTLVTPMIVDCAGVILPRLTITIKSSHEKSIDAQITVSCLT